MNLPSWPTLTVDEIAGLTFGAALLIQWGGDGFPEAARFEDRQGMPAREGWVTLADVIDGETKVWLNVEAVPLPAEAIEELKLTPAQIHEREAEARLAEIAAGVVSEHQNGENGAGRPAGDEIPAVFDADFEEETPRERETREVFERLRREAEERQAAVKPAFPRADRFYREPETRVWVRLEAPGVELRALLTPEAAKAVVDAMLGEIGANE